MNIEILHISCVNVPVSLFCLVCINAFTQQIRSLYNYCIM